MATKYIDNRLKEPNHLVLGVLQLTDFFVVYAHCQAVMADATNALMQITVHMNKNCISWLAYLNTVSKYYYTKGPEDMLKTDDKINICKMDQI